MPRMPWRAQAAMISGSVHWTRTVAVLSASRSESGGVTGPPGSAPRRASGLPRLWRSCVDTVDREQRAHARRGKIGIAQQTRGIGEAEQLGKMDDAARALLATDHREVRLVAVQPCHEHDAG